MGAAKTAIDDTTSAVSNMGKEFAVGYSGAKELGEITTLAGTQARESMYEARGEAELLGEMVGVHLPRHVRSFISELPGVGVALSAAFQATAVLFIIEALAKVVEKIIQWREEAYKLQLAQEEFGTTVANSFNALDAKLLQAGIRADELRGDHLDALKKELELIDHQSLHELEQQFNILAKAADALFKQLETSFYTFESGSKGAEHALTDFKAKYDLLIATGQDKEASDLLAGTKKSAEEVLTLMQRFQNIKGSPNDSLEETNRKNAEALQIINQLKERGAGYDDKAIKAQEALVTVLSAQANAEKEIAAISDQEKANKQTEEANRIEEEHERILKTQLAEQKRADEEEDKLEDDRRNKFIANMQEEEKEKVAATKQGSQERINILDAAIKEEEAHGFQDTAYYKSLQVERVRAVEARIDQEQKAQLKADQDALKNADQQAKREVESVKESSTEQEKAIEQLGKLKLLSQSETSRRLIAAYEDEKDKTLGVLNRLLNEERALMEKASTQLANAKMNHAITPEQLQQAEQLLNQLKNAVANTEAQIAKVKADTQAKELANEKAVLGQSVALYLAAGKQKQAAQLLEVHSALLSAQAQLADAKARGTNTQAMKDQVKQLEALVKELKTEEKELESDAHKGLSAWKQFGQGFRDEAQQNVKTLQQMAQEMEKDVASLGDIVSSAFSAMLSGQESFGAAMLHSTEKMISQMAQQWAEYFLAKGIADVFWDPPLGAAEIAAGVALEAIAGALGGLASGGSKSAGSTAARGTAAPAANSPASNAGAQPVTVINVQHLASGGLVTAPTLAVVGDARGGGAGKEAVIPLDDRKALQTIAAAIDLHIKTDIPSFVKLVNHGTKTGRLRLHSTSTDKTIRKA
jgi:hypothetical protein